MSVLLLLLLFMSIGLDYVSEMQPPMCLLFTPPDDVIMNSYGGMIRRGKNLRTQRKTCPSATLSTTHLTWTDEGTNLGLCSERLANMNVSHELFLIATSVMVCQLDHFG
jgi:hypothetical protein